METYCCPICSKELTPNPRYPKYICNECCSKATDANGRKLDFFNMAMSGGFKVVYADTKEEYDSHICFVKGIKCWADEAKFGGIVIEKSE